MILLKSMTIDWVFGGFFDEKGFNFPTLSLFESLTIFHFYLAFTHFKSNQIQSLVPHFNWLNLLAITITIVLQTN